jgi:hypothetical protein
MKMQSIYRPKFFVAGTVALLIAGGATSAPAEDIGINLNQNQWFRTQALWTDLTDSLGPWYSDMTLPANALVPSTSIDANGFPTIGQAWVASPLPAYAAGTYTYTYQGSSVLAFGGDATNATSTTVGNTTTGTVTFDPTKNDPRGFVIRYDRNSSSPITGLQLFSTSQGSLSNVFNNQTIQRLTPFSTTRYMDLLNTNSNTATMNWSNRTQSTFFTQSNNSTGISYENIVASANATKNNLWINIPVNATNDYIRNLGTFLSNNLDPSLKVTVEYGNEMWNFGTPAGAAMKTNALNDANTSIAGGDNSVTARAGREEAIKLQQIQTQLSLGYGDATTAGTAKSSFNNVGLTFGAFTRPDQAGYDFTTEGLNYFSSKLGVAPSSVIKTLAVAGYVDTGLSDPNTAPAPPGGTVLDGIFKLMNNELDPGGTVYNSFQQNETLAKSLGVQLSVYEGGQSLLHDTAGTFANAAQSDPRMALLYHRLFQTWNAVGGTGPFLAYSYADANTDFGAWGLLNNGNDKGSMKWDAVLREMLTPGDVNLDGTVDYTDFQLLCKNYGQTGMWWEQGNFDSQTDGTVDGADLLAMYNNLTGLTPTQLQSVFDFAALKGIQLPEPTTAAAMAAGLAKLSMRRPRKSH